MTNAYNCFFCDNLFDRPCYGHIVFSEDHSSVARASICQNCMDKLRMRKGSL